jgi:two-component system sensor histidine kinase DegS
MADVCKSLIDRNQLDKVNDSLLDIQEKLSQCIHELRRIVCDLRPPCLSNSGLFSTLQAYLNTVEIEEQVSCNLKVTKTMPPLNAEVQRSIYYVVREAVTNARKHADASEIRVLSQIHGDNLTVTISDNGKGFKLASENEDYGTGHQGIRTMKERARFLNGSLEIKSSRKSGTTVNLVVPIIEANAVKAAVEPLSSGKQRASGHVVVMKAPR